MRSDLSEIVGLLRADAVADVVMASTRLGLLLERSRFQRRGTGSLGDLDPMLGQLADIDLSEADVLEVLSGLREHLNEHGLDSNPTVVWAIGKAHDLGSSTLVAQIAESAIDQPERSDLLYQALVALAAVGADAHRDLFVRVARDARGDSAEFAAQQVLMRGWQ